MTQIEMDVARSTLRKNKAVAEHLEKIDWEQRRYEIAKEMLVYAASSNEERTKIGSSEVRNVKAQDAAKLAVGLADALIEELKKK